MSRILVIGGYGGFGARLSRRLLDDGHYVIVGGRNAGAAARFCAGAANAEPIELDRTGDLRPLIEGIRPDVVIDAAGPFQNSRYSVAEACIDCRVSYLDLADARAFVIGIRTLDEAARGAGVAVISGASTLPALSGAVVRHLADGMDRVDQVLVSLSASTRSTANGSVVRAILSYLGKPLPLWRGGRWDRAFGWQELRRVIYAVHGVAPLKRWIALADVPDLELLPASLPGNPNVEFRAGTDIPLHMFGLWVMSWLVRWALIQSLIPLSGWLLRLQRGTAFARGERSAMQVLVKGKAGAAGVERQWTLIAENHDGPEIPTMAAALLAGDLADGKVASGARDASHLLTLDSFEPLFARLRLRTEIGEWRTRSLYERVLQERFAELPEAIRSIHGVYGDAGALGEGSVTIGGGLLGSLICRIMRFPPAGAYPVHVHFSERDGCETWTRDFGGHRFRSHLALKRAQLTERFGPLRFAFDLPSDSEGLRMVLRGWDAFGVPLPLFMAPRINAAEWEDAGRFRFSVVVSLPLIGEVVRYAGWLRRTGLNEDAKRTPRRVRSAL